MSKSRILIVEIVSSYNNLLILKLVYRLVKKF